MTAFKVLLLAIALFSVWSMARGQPTDIEPHIPPIPDPPYPHKVRFCGIADDATFSLNSTSLDNCNWPRYFKSFAPFVAGPIVLAAIALVICFILPFIFCFPCCKRGPVGGFVRLFMVAAFGALLTIGFVLIFVGNSKTSRVVNNLSATINTTMDEAATRLDSARSIAAQLPYSNTSEALDTFNGVQAQLASFRVTTDGATSKVRYYDSLRKAALFVAALVPLVMIIVAGILVILNIGRPLMGVMAWLLVFLSILVWICIGVHLAVGKALSDVCWEVDLAHAQGSSGTLAIIVECQTDATPLTELRDQVNGNIQNATNDACDILESGCVANGGPISCTTPSWDCTESTIPEWPDFDITDAGITCDDGSFQDPADGCPGGSTSNGTFSTTRLVRDCPTQCQNPRFAQGSQQGVDSIDTLNQYYGLRDDLTPLLSCGFVADAFFSAKKEICTTFENSLTLIFTGGALEAAGMGLAMAALVHCFMGLSGKKDLYNPRDTL